MEQLGADEHTKEGTMENNKNMTMKLIAVVVLLIIAILSVTVFTDYATSVEVHAESIKILDEKKMTALGLTASVTAVSTAISAIPGDAATPIAEEVAELATPLLIIVCAIYCEKFLLTIMGYASFTLLIPVACVFLGVYLFTNKDFLKVLSVKLTILAIAIYTIIPVSVKVTGLIEATFEESINQTYETVDVISDEAEKSTEEEESKGFLDFLASIGEGATEMVESAKNALSVFVDAIAVLIITTCVIPIAVLLFFIWIIKLLFGVEIKIPHSPKQLVDQTLLGK